MRNGNRMEGDVVNVPHAPLGVAIAAPAIDEVTASWNEERCVRVPRGHVWLQGDNQSISRDSREYGPVPLALLRGRAMCVVGQNMYKYNLHTPCVRSSFTFLA